MIIALLISLDYRWYVGPRCSRFHRWVQIYQAWWWYS